MKQPCRRSVLVALLLTLSTAACHDDLTDQGEPDLVFRAGSLGIFVTYMVSAESVGFLETLQGPGPYTLFLPTDQAFQVLPTPIRTELSENPDFMEQMVLNHVVEGRYTLAEALEAGTLETLTGQEIVVVVEPTTGDVQVNGAGVAVFDGDARNGVLHGIGRVLLPGQEDVVDTATEDDRLTTLVELFQVSGLAETLQGDGRFTVFAPTDQAFSDLPEGELDALREDPEALRDLLEYHIVADRLSSVEVSEVSDLTTVQGSSLPVEVADNGIITVGGATLVDRDIQGTNGVIHILDTVLAPGG